jgi:hypothetical protein
MKRIKTWWNGREVVVDDGGYAPRLETRLPWVRTLSNEQLAVLLAVFGVVAPPVFNDLYAVCKQVVIDFFVSTLSTLTTLSA